MKFQQLYNLIYRKQLILEDFKSALNKWSQQAGFEITVQDYINLFKDSIRHKTHAPWNDIQFWQKKPFKDFKEFCDSFKSKREARKQFQNKSEIVGNAQFIEDDFLMHKGYQIIRINDYEAAKYYGRFYKGKSVSWCISTDNDFYFNEKYAESLFYFLIAVDQTKVYGQFFKIAIQITPEFNLVEDFQDKENHCQFWDIDDNNNSFYDYGDHQIIQHIFQEYKWENPYTLMHADSQVLTEVLNRHTSNVYDMFDIDINRFSADDAFGIILNNSYFRKKYRNYNGFSEDQSEQLLHRCPECIDYYNIEDINTQMFYKRAVYIIIHPIRLKQVDVKNMPFHLWRQIFTGLNKRNRLNQLDGNYIEWNSFKTKQQLKQIIKLYRSEFKPQYCRNFNGNTIRNILTLNSGLVEYCDLSKINTGLIPGISIPLHNIYGYDTSLYKKLKPFQDQNIQDQLVRTYKQFNN